MGFDKYKSKGAYHWDEILVNPYYRDKVEIISRYISGSMGRVMDLGCGDGAYMYYLSKSCKEIYGIDADYDAIRLARTKFQDRYAENCFCYQAPFSKIPTQEVGGDQSFDLIYSMDVIEHLPQPKELLDVSKKFLKKGGTLIIGTPLFVSKELISPYHVTEYSKPEIRSILKDRCNLLNEHIVPMERKDGKVYEEGFYIGVLNFND